ncbi:MAG: HAMP domain-containing protein [Chitinophagaceae bacterium]|nr:MAG: HAMP domain-containing protein [Chitinophagaceae bacterium]
MKTKTKLNLAVGLLLTLIVLLSVISSFYVFEIKKDTDNILRANYNTLEYSRAMLETLDKMEHGNADAVADFNLQLQHQQNNITEAGEQQATDSLIAHFAAFQSKAPTEILAKTIRADVFQIMKLNLRALKVKSDQARRTAETANFIIAVAGTLCFLIAFNLMLNLPENIANPIRELTQSIGGIASGNYRQRLHFKNRNEFGALAASFNVMAEKLQEYDESNLNKLLVEKKRIETLLDTMHDPVIGIDSDGKIASVNEEASVILGIKPEAVIGKKTQEAAQANDLLRTLFLEPIDQKPLKIFAHGKESYFERQQFEISFTPTAETEASDHGSFIILRNITTFKELDFAKTNFIATVSHELKTPISAIKLSVNLLERQTDGPLSQGQQQLITGIREDSDRLLRITGELLEMSQLETGNIQLSIGRCEAVDIVSIALSAVKTQAEQKAVSLEVIDKTNGAVLKADRDKTSWVLINLLTNAIRYSPDGAKVSIEITDFSNLTNISVTDQGKGIDERYHTRLFDRYFQVPGNANTGTGLGLAISREFIEAQAGSIGVDSSTGNGSRFWFALPSA